MKLNPAAYLTDNYRTDRESNNFKLLKLSGDSLNELAFVLGMIERYRDMDEAKGKTLDRIGKNVLEYRNGDNDQEYRKRVRVKILSNYSGTDIETLNRILEILLEDNFERIGETWSSSRYHNEPAGLYVRTQNMNTVPEYVGEAKYLDGCFYLNGEYFLNGGYEYAGSVSPLERLNAAMEILNRIKAGGIGIYMEIVQKDILIFVRHDHSAKNQVGKRVTHKLFPALHGTQTIRRHKYLNHRENRLNSFVPLNGCTGLDGLRPPIVLNCKNVVRERVVI